jgi:hypothetical protein
MSKQPTLSWTNPAFELTQHDQVEGYTHYNFAILHGTGISHIFNFMRYNVACLARRSDFDMLAEVVKGDYSEWLNRRYAVLLCRYDWTGRTKAHWERGMLLSDQELEECSDVAQLFELGSDITVLRAPSKLKWKHTVKLKGPLAWVLQVMYENKAVPSQEADANRLEHAFYTPNEEVEVNLTNYLAVKTLWTLPAKT